VLLPGGGLHLNVGEATAGFRVLPAGHAQASGVGRCGLLQVSLIREHVAKLEEQRARARAVGPCLQLELEELLDHVQLAQVPVDAASRGQALDQPRIELVRVLEVLQRFDAGQELRLQHPPELQVELRLDGVRRLRRDPFLELLGEALPVADVL